MITRHADILHLGDELLLGLRSNTHLEYLGRQLAQHGISLRAAYVIRDRIDETLEALEQSWKHVPLIVITGGLGPTTDDLTRDAVSSFTGLPLIYNPEVRTAIEARFQRFGRPMTDNNLRQCYHPDGSEIIPNANGTAPGIWLNHQGRTLILLPGPPHELHPMWENQVLPRLIREGLAGSQLPYVQLRTCGIGESALETRVQEWLGRTPDPAIETAYCAHSGVVDLRLSSTDPETALSLSGRASQLALELGEDFVGMGECDLAKWVIRTLVEKGHSLAVAESCTGGGLAAALTDIPGASAAFLGGAITYTLDSKMQLLNIPEALLQQHGAVSAETAVAMASGAAERFGATHALSITGYAGPDGGDAQHPVGTVFIGYHAPCGAWASRFQITGDRKIVRQRSVVYALDLMRRKLQKYAGTDALLPPEPFLK
jgi:nicotinamide-nucleotide amidase